MSDPLMPAASPFYTIRPQPTWYTVIKHASDAVPIPKPESSDPPPWTVPPAAAPLMGPPARDWPVEADPPPKPEAKKEPEPPPDPFHVIRYIPWSSSPRDPSRPTVHAVPAPLVPAWNALRCLVELRAVRAEVEGEMALSRTVRVAMRVMEEEWEEERRKKEEERKKAG